MPQGRRKVPFSGKKKKQQLILKRQQKDYLKKPQNESEEDESATPFENLEKINYQPSTKAGSCKIEFHSSNANRYALQFHKETQKDLALSKERARLPLVSVPKEERQIDEKYFVGFNFPTRPRYFIRPNVTNYDNMTKEQVEAAENRYFYKYVERLEKEHNNKSIELSVFELNLETWRQLWRVIEMSDILLLIVDTRYGSLMVQSFLFYYVMKCLKKNVIIILNKIDLVEPELVLAWKDYFMKTYKIPVVLFTSYPERKTEATSSKKRKSNIKVPYECVHSIFNECKKIVGDKLDLTKWDEKILEDADRKVPPPEKKQDNDSHENEDSKVDGTPENFKYDNHSDEGETDIKFDYSAFCFNDEEHLNIEFQSYIRFKDNVLTIGCVGFPNVGKSSVINALKGKKVVSVSRTPGHTKHFQTIFLTENVKLCDCPGLVFPSSIPKYIQVIMGSYPISQLRDPYSTIKYVAERIDLPQLLSLQLPPDYDEWSAMAVCEAWALKRGFMTAKASRPDLYRAANHLLRMILDGKIVIEFYPPQYFENKEKLQVRPELEFIKRLQGQSEASGECERNNWSDSERETLSETDDSEEDKKIEEENLEEDSDDDDDDDDDDNPIS